MNPLPGLPESKSTPTEYPVSSSVVSEPTASITDVPSLQTILSQHRKMIVIVIVASVIWWVGLASLGSQGGSVRELFYILPVFLATLVYGHIRAVLQAEFMAAFARTHNLSFDKDGTVDETYGSLFQLPGSSAVSDVIRGQYQGRDSLAFLYERTVREGKSSVTYTYTTVELSLGGSVPPLLIQPKDMLGMGAFQMDMGESESVDLEGDFNKDFMVKVSKGLQIPAREILTPDIMEILQQQAKMYTVEFINDHVYLYSHGFVSSASSLQRMYDFLTLLAGKLKTEIAGFEADEAIKAASITQIIAARPTPKLFVYVAIAIMVISFGGMLMVYLSLMNSFSLGM